MNDKLNMDKQIREKLDGFSVAPPPHVWNNIQGKMAAQQKKKRLAYIGWISAAAVVVFAFLAGWFFNEKTNLLMPEMVEQQVVVPDNDKATNEQEAVTMTDNRNVVVAEIAKSKSKETNYKTQLKPEAQSVTEELEIENNFVASIERISYDLLESLDAIFTGEQHDVFLVEVKEEPTPEMVITNNDKLLMAANADNFKKDKTNNRGWIVGAYVSPGYSSHSANHEQRYAENMTYSGNSGAGNVGGGFSVQYKTSKRLRVESGVYYAQNEQSANSGSGGFFGFRENADYIYAAPEYIGNVSTSFSNVVQLNSSGIEMNSVAGVINMSAAPKGASVATNAENANAKNANTLNTNGEFSQVFEFVEVPLYVRYSVLDKKLGIEIMGGLNAGFTVGNTAYIDNDYGKQDIGSTADISSINLSGTVGLGMNYMLGKHLSLAFEPRFNYYLNSINTNPDVDYRPYRLGFFTGVYYEF